MRWYHPTENQWPPPSGLWPQHQLARTSLALLQPCLFSLLFPDRASHVSIWGLCHWTLSSGSLVAHSSLLQVFAQGSLSQRRPSLTTLFQIPTSLPTQHSCPPPPRHVVFSIPLIIWHTRYFTYMILSVSSPWRQRFLLYYIPII